MMARLLLLAGAAAGKELSFGRDGVELFRRVFDAADLARLRTAWDSVEANETIESEALEQGCVAAVGRTQRDGARRTVVAARLDRSVQGGALGPIRWDEPLVDGRRRLVESGYLAQTDLALEHDREIGAARQRALYKALLLYICAALSTRELCGL